MPKKRPALDWPGLTEQHRAILTAILLALGYWVLARYSLSLPVGATGISYVWPADGLALGVLLCTRMREWRYFVVAVFIGTFLASSKPLSMNLLYSAFNALEPLLVAFVITKVLGSRPRMDSVANAARVMFVITAVMVPAVLISTFADWLIYENDFWKVWRIWYVSNTLGMLIIAPLVLAFVTELEAEWNELTGVKYLELFVLVGGLITSIHFMFSMTADRPTLWANLSATPMMVPTIFLIWGAVRFGLPGGTLCMATLALASFWYTANGFGPYVTIGHDSRSGLLHLQTTLGVFSCLNVIVAAVATEWHHAIAESRASKKRLDRALDSARLALFEVDATTGHTYLSEGWAEMIHATPGQTNTNMRSLLDAIHPDDKDEAWLKALELRSGKSESFDREFRVRRHDGTWIWILSRARVVERDADGRTSRIAGTCVDITERKHTEQRLHHVATRDTLTDLVNRALFGDRLQKAIEEATYERAGSVALISADLNRFTEINDSLGQQVGDDLLKRIAERLVAAAGEENTVGRPGGDEFLILLPNVKSPHTVTAMTKRVQQAISEPLLVDGRSLVVTASIGVALFPGDAADAGAILRHADIALHHAKRVGGDNIQYFAEHMNIAARARMEIETEMRLGLQRDEFVVHYQPQVSMDTGALIGFEALVRWQHPARGLVAPRDFLAIAESTGLIVALGERVLRNACHQAANWQRVGGQPIRVAVNVTARQFRSTDFLNSVKYALSSAKLDPQLLELEIIENTLMERGADTDATFEALRILGVQLSIDDFGTGYSSLSYLKHLPIDAVKIDQSFVADLPHDDDAGAIVGAIIALAHSLGLQVLAEGVETKAQFDYLREHGCDNAQGFLIGHPQPAESMPIAVDRAFVETANYAATQ